MRARWWLAGGALLVASWMLLFESNAWAAWLLLLVLVAVLIVLEVFDELRASDARDREALAAEVARRSKDGIR